MLTAQCYLVIGLSTLKADTANPMRRAYMGTTGALAAWSGFYGLMTITADPGAAGIFWVGGFLGTCLFFPAWTHFLLHLSGWSMRRRNFLLGLLYASCTALGIACVFWGDVRFISTPFGTQFTYSGALFKIIFIFFAAVPILFFWFLQWRWYLSVRLKRQRKQARIFFLTTLIVTPPVVWTDFVVPGFLNSHTVPLGVIFIVVVSLLFYRTVRVYSGLNVTVENAANAIFKSVTLPVLLLDHENRVIKANEGAAAFWDEARGRPEGANMAELFTVDGEAPLRDFFNDSLDGRFVRVAARSGSRVCDMLLTVTRDEDGDVLNKVVVLHDVTDIQNALQQAKEGSRAKSEFLSRMSHELRTPLNAVVGMAQIAKNSLESADRNEKTLSAVDNIIKASDHLLAIINDVLDMSKIEAGKFEIACAPFDFIAALSETASMISQRCADKGVFFTHNINESHPPRVCGDKLRLNQVLINILGNSVKFTAGGGSVAMKLETRQVGGTVYAEFELSDTGIGMSEAFMSRIFTPFEQADAAISGRFGGTGLGLALSRNLVTMMGGSIEVESAEGKGSTFRITLPFTVAESREQEARVETGAICDMDFSGKRMLLVEDVEVNRLIFKELVGATGVVIEEAEDGRQALEKYSASPALYYDLVLMDIQMPHMNGYEATQSIRALDRPDAKTVPIIAMTANAYHEDVCNALQAGMNGHLAKPINLEIVLRTLASYLA